MRKNCFVLAFAAFLAAMSAQSSAQDAQTIADIRCVVIGMRMGGTGNAAQQSAGGVLALYYIGRLDGRVPSLNIEDLIVQQITKMTKADYDSEGKRCGAVLKEKGQQLTQIGKDLVERGQKMQNDAKAPSD